jgi:hypothetical protein
VSLVICDAAILIASAPPLAWELAWELGLKVEGVPVSDEYATLLAVASEPSPLTSVEAIVTVPVRPATLTTFADTVPLLTESPAPTTTPPKTLLVAFGNVYPDATPISA